MFKIIRGYLPSPRDREKGANMVEYSLIGILVAVACAAGAVLLGQQTSQSFSNIGSGIAPN
jgi:Flp pilus assembly pilin Flp